MALTAFQQNICQVLAGRRRAGGESYVAGGIALNVAIEAHRLSRDLGFTTVPSASFRWLSMRSWGSRCIHSTWQPIRSWR